MSLMQEDKKKLVEAFGKSANDTGSSYAQVAMLTERIRQLTEHLKTHAKDFSSKRGLLKMIANRRSFLQYIARKDEQGYKDLVKRLNLRK